MQQVYEFNAVIHEVPDNGGAYVVFPWNIREEFGKASPTGQDLVKLKLYEEQGGVRFGEVPLAGAKNIGLFIGSEGGISEEEAAEAENAGISRVWLGNRILRCETAPTAALSILMYLTQNL